MRNPRRASTSPPCARRAVGHYFGFIENDEPTRIEIEWVAPGLVTAGVQLVTIAAATTGVAVAVLILPFLLALDAIGLDAAWFIVPGQFLGMAVSRLAGAVRVRRWEGAHRSRVAARFADGRVTALYAVPRL